MVPDLTLEVIYLNQPTDFKMEFDLCVNSNVRFLSHPVKSRGELLTALSKSVVRSRAIITVGSFNPLDQLYIPKIIAKATGYELKSTDNEKFGIDAEKTVFLPEGSMPLVDKNGNVGGCVLENNDQTIIMLTTDRELRHSIVEELVCPYLRVFADKKTKSEGLRNIIEQSSPESSTQENESPVEENIVSEAGVMPEPALEEKVTADEVASEPEPGITPEAEYNFTEKSPEEVEILPLGEEPLLNTDTIVPEKDVTAQNLQSENQPTEESVVPVETVSETLETPEEKPKYTVMEQPNPEQNKAFDLDEFLISDTGYEKGKSKKKHPIIKVIISIILVLAVILASYFGYDRLFQPMQRASVYDEVRKLYGQTWSKLPDDMLYKFGKLYQTNTDIYGWLSLPNTNINLPVVSSYEKSTSYYRTHLFEGSVNRYGTLYTTSQLLSGGYHRNTVIYGKNTGDDTMLSELYKFLDAEYYMQAPTFTFDTLYFENKWKIFSVFKINARNEKSYLKTDFFDDSEFELYLESLEKVSAISTNIDVTFSDQIVTLVAQDDETDVILVARRVRDGESPLVDVTGTTENYDFENSSDIPVIADPLKPIDTSSEMESVSEMVDSNMMDGASSRYEQHEPTSSTIEVKPTVPTVTSVPTISSKVSSSTTTSNKPSSSKTSSANKSSSEVKSSSNSTSSVPAISGKLPELTVTNTFNGKKVKGDAVSIVAQNIEAEMGSGYHIEALKAQAVAAYSWLLNNGSAMGEYPSLPLKTPSAKCLEAANAVAGQVAVYGGKVATTYYYAISAGRSAYSQDIWSSAVPYLVSVDSSVDKSVNGYQTVRKYSSSQVADIAKDLLDIDLTTITDKNKWFTCSYDVNGIYCTKIKIGTVTKTGPYMRNTFFSAARVGAANVLRSSAYTIAYNQSEDKFIFTVRGYGHGVGMSQTGANQYAKSGWGYEKILKHYFTGISLGTYYVN